MSNWEWSQWALIVLIAGNLVLGAYQYGRRRQLERDTVSTAVALGLSCVLLGQIGFW